MKKSVTYRLENTLLINWSLQTGTDEGAIIELLGNRTCKQRVPMVADYKTTYGKVRPSTIQLFVCLLRSSFAAAEECK